MVSETPALDLDAINAEVEEARQTATAPLRERLKLVEGRERLIIDDLAATREMKKVLVTMLRKLDPTMSGPGRTKAKSNGGRDHAEKNRRYTIERVRQYVDRIAPDFPDGFTRSRVKEAMQAAGEGFGDKRLVVGMDALHESGYLTLHKLVTGGNKSYKRTEDLTP